MAPLPVSQKLRPERMALRHGVQDGALTSVGEKNPLACQFIEIRGLGDVVDATRSLDLGIDGGLPSPVIGESKKQVWSFGFPTTEDEIQAKKETNKGKASNGHRERRLREKKKIKKA